jgi:hypothetical protein
MNLNCDVCRLKKEKEKGGAFCSNIFNFPFQIYTNKTDMKNDITTFLERCGEDELFRTKEDKYKNTIIHELIYLIGCKTYNEKQFRKQYMWGLEILSELDVFRDFLTLQNAKGETPAFIHFVLSEDFESAEYKWIKNLLGTFGYTSANVNQSATDQNDTATVVSINPSDLTANELEEPARKGTLPEVKCLTAQYHRIQDKLFHTFRQLVPGAISTCSSCGKSIDIFSDFTQIAEALKRTQNKITLGFIRHNLGTLISLRRRCIAISEPNAITRRHKHVADLFEQLKNNLVEKPTQS